MAEQTKSDFPKSNRMAEYAARNGKPNAQVQSAGKGASSSASKSKGPASSKGGCSCNG